MRICPVCMRTLDQDEGLCRCQREKPWLREVLDDAKAAHAERPNWAKAITNADIELTKVYQAAIDDLIRKHPLAVNDLTEKQFAEAIRQACACGDFQRYVCPSNSSQCVVYIPHAREAYLTGRIRELEEQLRLAKVTCTLCGGYLPGHATGNADICTCV